MASTAMHQHQPLDAGGHQSNRTAANGRHHLTGPSSVLPSYHHHNQSHNHLPQQQYNSSSYLQEQRQAQDTVLFTSIRNQQQHYADNNSDQHNRTNLSSREQSNAHESHFYHQSNSQQVSTDNNSNQDSNQYSGHYHYAASNYATQAQATAAGAAYANGQQQQHYDSTNGSQHHNSHLHHQHQQPQHQQQHQQQHHHPALDHYACNPHYSFMQSFSARPAQNPTLHQSYAAVYATNEAATIDRQPHQSYHHHHGLDQGQSVGHNHESSRGGVVKIERNENSAPARSSNKRQQSHHHHHISDEFNGSETVLTELGPKTLLAQRNGFVPAADGRIDETASLVSETRTRLLNNKTDSEGGTLSLAKRKKLATKVAGYSEKGEEDDNDDDDDDDNQNYATEAQQLDSSSYRTRDNQHQHQQHSLVVATTYLNNTQRPQPTGSLTSSISVEEREHEQTSSIDRSSAGGGSISGGLFVHTTTPDALDSTEQQLVKQHQGYSALPALMVVDSSVSSLSPGGGHELSGGANLNRLGRFQSATTTATPYHLASSISAATSEDEAKNLSPDKQTTTTSTTNSNNGEFNQLRILEMRKEKSRDAARSRRSKENHEFYELAKLLPLPAAITSQLDFLDKASIIRLTISFLKLRQFSVNGHPPWAPDFTTLGSINPYSSQSLSNYAEHYSASPDEKPISAGNLNGNKQRATPVPTSSSTNNQQSAAYNSNLNNNEQQVPIGAQSQPPSSVAFPVIDSYRQQQLQPATCHQDGSLLNEKNLSKSTVSLFDIHQGTHILQSLDGFAFAIGRDGRFLYISETVSMYLGLSQVEMTGSSVFDYTHQQDHEELARQLGISYATSDCNPRDDSNPINSCESPPPDSVQSHYSAASNETLIEDYVKPNSNSCSNRKRAKTITTNATTASNINTASQSGAARGAYGRNGKRAAPSSRRQNPSLKIETTSDMINSATATPNLVEGHESIQLGAVSQRDSDGKPVSNAQGTNEDPLVRQFCIRMKSTLTKRGCQHFKSSGYRVVHVVAHLRAYQSNDHGHLMDPLDEAGSLTGGGSGSGAGALKQPKRRGPKQGAGSGSGNSKDQTGTNKESSKVSNDNNNTTISDTTAGERDSRQKIIGMVAVAIALPPPSINELRLESDTFVLRLGLDLRVTHIEPKITELLHFPIDLIAGRSLYSLIHPADVHQVQKCHKDLLRKGQMMSGYYRLLARNGGYIWIQTCATLICNNTLGGQAVILPANSPMPTPNTSSHPHNQQHHGEHLQKVPSYLATPDLNAAATTAGQYNLSGSGNHSKMLTPSLSNSHLAASSGGGQQYANQEQDQCVIFVNHMITNIVEGNEILDICQSLNYTPLSSFSGNAINTTTNSSSCNSNNVIFNSPSSSCSSPCLANSMKNNNTASCGSYASPATPNSSSVNLSSPRRHHSNSITTAGEDKMTTHTRETKLANGRRSTVTTSSNFGAVKMKQPKISYLGDENGHDGHINAHTFSISGEQIKVDTINCHYDNVGSDTTSTSSCVYGYSQTPGSVNLALNKVHQAEPSWLGQQPIPASAAAVASGRLSEASTAVYGAASGGGGGQTSGADHYSNMNRSIYKAAFGLDVSGSSYNPHHHHHHQQAAAAAAAVVYPANTPTYPSSATANTTWDTTAAVAAVAAASNLSNHHHHQQANPYAHLESHHQNAHTLSSAAANHHHSQAGSYYNYYGYYGNKFI